MEINKGGIFVEEPFNLDNVEVNEDLEEMLNVSFIDPTLYLEPNFSNAIDFEEILPQYQIHCNKNDEYIDINDFIQLQSSSSNLPSGNMDLDSHETKNFENFDESVSKIEILNELHINCNQDDSNNFDEDAMSVASFNAFDDLGRTVNNDIAIENDIVDSKSLEFEAKEDILETVTISSADFKNDEDDSLKSDSHSLCDGYHSSDFEFITEEEAKTDGYIITFNPDRTFTENSKDMVKTLSIDHGFCENEVKDLEYFKAGPSTRPNVYFRRNSKVSESSEDCEHKIPDGDNYLRLFQGNSTPVLTNSDIMFLENKAILPRTSMHMMEYQGLGFDVNRFNEESSNNENREEAEESKERILKMYSVENRKFTRRHRRRPF